MSLHCCVYIAFFKFYGREIYRFNYMRYHISHSSPNINIRGMQLAYSVIFNFYKPCLWSNVYFWTVWVLRGRILYHDLLLQPKDDVNCIWSIKIFLVINDANIGIIKIDRFGNLEFELIKSVYSLMIHMLIQYELFLKHFKSGNTL